MYLNSPMAIAATDIYERFRQEHRASVQDLNDMFELATPVQTVEESKALNLRKGPMIIISSAGMLTGGRVLHHVATFGVDPRNAILLAGFQAGGTRGAALLAGRRELRMFGQRCAIGAEVLEIQGLSGHADAEGILAWAAGGRRPRQCFITHGEPEAADVLRGRFERESCTGPRAFRNTWNAWSWNRSDAVRLFRRGDRRGRELPVDLPSASHQSSSSWPGAKPRLSASS